MHICSVLFVLLSFQIVDGFISRSRSARQNLNRLRFEIPEYGDDEEVREQKKTEEELQLSHGYEGDFKVGERVKVNRSLKFWSVKQYMKTGFDPLGYTGTIVSFALYGKKYKTLCSAITPIRVEFQPDGEGIPPGMFDKKFILHFSKDEIERI